jgi:hypothetical protein
MTNIRPFARLAVAALLLATLAAPASAYRMIQNTGVGRFSAGAQVRCNANGGFTHWGTANISWRHNSANQGSGKDAAIANALAVWTNVANANHSPSLVGNTTAGFVTDGINTTLWAAGNGCTGSCLAITALVLQSGQLIVESDISFNNSVAWNTNGSDYDTEAIAAHEFGHSLGIHHTEKNTTPRPTMYAYYFGTTGRTLESDDAAALQCSQSRYPPSAAQFAQEPVTEAAVGRAAVRLSARPRSGGAVLRYALEFDQDVEIQLFDIAGRELVTLVSGRQSAGDHELAWDGTTRSGRVPSGMYFARMVTPSGTARASVIVAE